MFDQQKLLNILLTARSLTSDEYATMFESLKRRINEVGIPVEQMNHRTDHFGWDGSTIRISPENTYRKVCDLAHEFSHWLVCPDDRRHIPEFGLGAGFSTMDGYRAEQLKVVSEDEAIFEEVATCYVAAALLYEIGADVLGESETVSLVDGDNGFAGQPSEVEGHVKLAIERGALDETLQVIWPKKA